MRKLLIGVALIVALTGAALVAIWALTRSGPSAPATDAPVAAVPEVPQPPPPTPPTPQQLTTFNVPPPAGPRASVEFGPPRPEPPKGSWEAVPVSARLSALGPLGGAIGRGLIELQPRLAACFDEDTAARFGPQPRSVAMDGSLPDAGTPVLLLEIETGGGGARIVDAPVDTQGGASDGVISCAQSILRGQQFSYAQAPAGGKHRVLHPLTR